jgi:hypothetical protein
MTQFNVGDKVTIDDTTGIIESITVTDKGAKYDVRYTSMDMMIAVDVLEDDLELIGDTE